MGHCIHCGKEVFLDSEGVVREKLTDEGISQYCWIDPLKGSQLHELTKDDILLDQYSQERGVGFTLPELIGSHRRLIKELNEHHRKKSLEEVKALQDRVFNMQMDATWIKIEKLKTMTLQEIIDLIGTSTEE